MTIVNFCTNDIKQKNQYSEMPILLMSNFSFLLKASMMQVIVVGLCQFPSPALGLMIALESLYVGVDLIQYLKHQHLKSFAIFLLRITSSLLILTVEFCLLIPYIKLESWSYQLSPASQNVVIKAILISGYTEYGLFGINILVVLSMMFQEKKRKSADQNYKKFSE